MNLKNIKKMPVDKNLIEVTLIAHVRGPRGSINNLQLQCNETEKFTVDEFYEIYSGIVSAGYFINRTYFNELDFIQDYMENPKCFNKSIIFNLARNGIKDNKKALIPSFCDMVSLPYTTSGSFSCSLARNKKIFKTILQEHNIKVPHSWDTFKEVSNKGINVIKKPISESASQGISDQSIFSLDDNNSKDTNSYFYQEYIEGLECEVPVFKIKNQIFAMDPVGIDLKGNKILTYNNSLNDNYSFYDLTHKIDKNIIDDLKSQAIKTFQVLDMDIYGRIDFRINEKGEAFVFDVSSTPYITKHSSFDFAFHKEKLEYFDIFDIILKLTMDKFNIF